MNNIVVCLSERDLSEWFEIKFCNKLGRLLFYYSNNKVFTLEFALKQSGASRF